MTTPMHLTEHNLLTETRNQVDDQCNISNRKMWFKDRKNLKKKSESKWIEIKTTDINLIENRIVEIGTLYYECIYIYIF